MSTTPAYPEHEKLKACAAESQAIGAFLDFGLGRQGLSLAEAGEYGGLQPTSKSIQEILAGYFGIDLRRLDAEKAAMLENMRPPPRKRGGEPACQTCADRGTVQGRPCIDCKHRRMTDYPVDRITCRAQVSPGCLHGDPVRDHYGRAMGDDGTYDGASVVCDACYVALMPLTSEQQVRLDELPDAIRAARAA